MKRLILIYFIIAANVSTHHLYGATKNNRNGYKIQDLVPPLQRNAVSILKVEENGHIFYYAIIVPSYLTRNSKTDVRYFQKYSTLQAALDAIHKYKKDSLQKSDYLSIEGCLAIIQYDQRNIKIIRFDHNERNMIEQEERVKQTGVTRGSTSQ